MLYISILTYITCSRDGGLGFGSVQYNLRKFFNNATDLQRNTFIWPPIDDLLYSGNTIGQLYDIESASRRLDVPCYNFSVYPHYPIKNSDPLPSSGLIMRTYPASNEDLGVAEPGDPKEDRRTAIKTWWKVKGLASLRWFSVPKETKEMEDRFGKICVYLVGGKFQYAVHCKGADVALVTSYVQLTKIGYA